MSVIPTRLAQLAQHEAHMARLDAMLAEQRAWNAEQRSINAQLAGLMAKAWQERPNGHEERRGERWEVQRIAVARRPYASN